jgi:VWFA-related protein
MTPRLAATVVAAAALLAAPDRLTQTGQVFRASASAISVPVAVLDKGRPVPDLAPARFALFDNSVMQEISLIQVGRLAIDVTLVLDTSGSVSGDALRTLVADVQTIVAALGLHDRVRLLTFSREVREAIPLGPGAGALDLATVAPGGSTAFFNAIAAALLAASSPGRPHLVIAMGDGGDNTSWLREDEVLGVARRTDAVLHVLVRDRWEGTTCPGCVGGIGWLPYAPTQDGGGLTNAALVTGGGYHRVRAGAPMADVLARVVDDFKAAYLLWFEPSGPPAPGWHDLVVRVQGGPYEVRARRGYFGG